MATVAIDQPMMRVEMNEKDDEMQNVSTERTSLVKTEHIYEVIKSAASDVKVGNVLLAERAISIVDGVALALSNNVFHLTQEDGFRLSKHLDELTVHLLRGVDSKVAVICFRFARAVDTLQSAVIAHTEWTSEVLKNTATTTRKQTMEKVDELRSSITSTVDPVVSSASSVYGQADTTLRSFLSIPEGEVLSVNSLYKSATGLYSSVVGTATDTVYLPVAAKATEVYDSVLFTAKDRVYDPAVGVYTSAVDMATAKSTAAYESLMSAANDKVVAPAMAKSTEIYETNAPRVAELLVRAQPLVHRVVSESRPYVTKAVEISKPSFERAMTLGQPVIQRAVAVSAPYVAHPSVQDVLNRSTVMAEAVVLYCDPTAVEASHPLYSAPSSSTVSAEEPAVAATESSTDTTLPPLVDVLSPVSPTPDTVPCVASSVLDTGDSLVDSEHTIPTEAETEAEAEASPVTTGAVESTFTQVEGQQASGRSKAKHKRGKRVDAQDSPAPPTDDPISTGGCPVEPVE